MVGAQVRDHAGVLQKLQFLIARRFPAIESAAIHKDLVPRGVLGWATHPNRPPMVAWR